MSDERQDSFFLSSVLRRVKEILTNEKQRQTKGERGIREGSTKKLGEG